MPNAIQDYHSKPSFEPQGKSAWGIYLGVELEVEVKDDADKDNCAILSRKALNNFVITKHDGSLQNGFEICSSPATLAFHKEKWRDFFFKERVDGLRISDRCGMHVHISRNPMSNLQIGKILSFIHSPANRRFIKTIAQRDSGAYNNFVVARKHSDALKGGNIERRSAVNLANPNTIEIRLFQSTLKGVEFFKNLEFCEALTNFTFPSVSSLKDGIKVDEFLKFIVNQENRARYPNLINYLNKCGFQLGEKRKKMFLPGFKEGDVLKIIKSRPTSAKDKSKINPSFLVW